MVWLLICLSKIFRMKSVKMIFNRFSIVLVLCTFCFYISSCGGSDKLDAAEAEIAVLKKELSVFKNRTNKDLKDQLIGKFAGKSKTAAPNDNGQFAAYKGKSEFNAKFLEWNAAFNKKNSSIGEIAMAYIDFGFYCLTTDPECNTILEEKVGK